jgi:isopenicillin N synthase-like dioxygenase
MAQNRRVLELSLLSYKNGSTLDQNRFVDNLMLGLKEYGFIILKDHFVDQNKVDDAYTLVKEFFNLPNETKTKYAMGNGGQRGYTPFKVEHAKDHKYGDLKEFWHVGRELSEASPYLNTYPKNVWPTEIKNMQNVFLELYSAMDNTSNILLEAIGKGLDLPKTYFEEMVKDGNSIIRMIHYPPTKGEDTKNSIRSAAHEDINLITLLVGATDSGLQLKDRDGTWLDVNSKPGEIVVDTGDMMSRLTNDVLPSTTHRVINPTNDSSARFSMPFFVHPHSNASLKCIPSCVGTEAKYAEITAGDFLKQRLKEIGLY